MKIKSTLLILALSLTTALAEPTPSPVPQPDKLKEALAQMIAGVTQTTGQAKDFILAQLPDVVKQLLAWKFAESIANMLIPTFILIIWGLIVKRLVYKAKITEFEFGGETEDFCKFVGCGIGMILTVICSIWWACSLNLIWLEIWVAPKIYLIDYAKSLVK